MDLVTHNPAQIPFRLFDVAAFGQIFTPEPVVQAMLALRRNGGRVLEPACGDGAFLRALPGAVGVEIDPTHCPPGARNIDFFAYPERERFDTIIGNPPYVRFQDIPADTRKRLRSNLFDGRSNLYLFFIEKCLRHLAPGGELIFITPRDFMKATSAVRLNRLLYEQGSITDAIELGDARVFDDAVPNCLIWRFEKDCRDRSVRHAEVGVSRNLRESLADPQWETRYLVEFAGHLMFARGDYPLRLSDIAFVKVGAVSGADEIYADDVQGNRDFVCSSTVKTGRTRRMIWCEPGEAPPQALIAYRARLIARRIRRFDDSNWWQWGRGYYQSDRPRVYVNGKTRATEPFFVHPCTHYDGAVLAVFPHDPAVDPTRLRDALNAVDWADLGFVCDGRHLFTQRSLENSPLPVAFRAFLPPVSGAADPVVQYSTKTGA
ncbi:Eco57I restriction-modification methylase domain-containing protein [Rhodocyclaceae bacterium SMB388]